VERPVSKRAPTPHFVFFISPSGLYKLILFVYTGNILSTEPCKQLYLFINPSVMRVLTPQRPFRPRSSRPCRLRSSSRPSSAPLCRSKLLTATAAWRLATLCYVTHIYVLYFETVYYYNAYYIIFLFAQLLKHEHRDATLKANALREQLKAEQLKAQS
jgi:hypothetical protein